MSVPKLREIIGVVLSSRGRDFGYEHTAADVDAIAREVEADPRATDVQDKRNDYINALDEAIGRFEGARLATKVVGNIMDAKEARA